MIPEILELTGRDVGATGRVLTARGEIDHDTCKLLHDAVAESLGHGRFHVVLDLTGVRFCDSGGLSAFVDAHRRTAAAGGWLRLAGAGADVLTVLRMTNLDRYLHLYATPGEAVANL